MEKSTQRATPKYLKEDAINTDVQREGRNLDSSYIVELLPQSHKININRCFDTSDATVLKWYYDLASKGLFGERLAHLMALDAYGKIPDTSTFVDLSLDDKVNQLCNTVQQMTNMLIRNQKMTESNMVAQAKSIKYLQNVTLTVKSQGEILKAIEAVLVSENKYTPEQIKIVLDSIKRTIQESTPIRPTTPTSK